MKKILTVFFIFALLLISESGQAALQENDIPFSPLTGVYSLNLTASQNDNDLNISTTLTLNSINKSAGFYNYTIFESLKTMQVFIIETGQTQEQVINKIFITDTNLTDLTNPQPVYTINNSVLSTSFEIKNLNIPTGIIHIQVIATMVCIAVPGLAIAQFTDLINKTITFNYQNTNESSVSTTNSAKTSDFYFFSFLAIPLYYLYRKRTNLLK